MEKVIHTSQVTALLRHFYCYSGYATKCSRHIVGVGSTPAVAALPSFPKEYQGVKAFFHLKKPEHMSKRIAG